MKNKFNNIEIRGILFGFVASISLLMMIHDYLTSVLFKQSYYFSESILFKIPIVLLIVPIFIYRTIKIKGAEVDFKFSKEINVTKIMLYLIPIVVIHIMIASLLIAFISQTFMESHFTFRFLIQNKFNQDFIFLLTIYGLMFLISRYYSLNILPYKEMTIQSLSIKQGAKTEMIAVNDIEWISAETPYVGLWIENIKHLYPSTLSDILTKLNNDDFVRIHRSTIVNISKIDSIHSRSNGDYDIKLSDNTLLRLSRNYRHQFNTRFK